MGVFLYTLDTATLMQEWTHSGPPHHEHSISGAFSFCTHDVAFYAASPSYTYTRCSGRIVHHWLTWHLRSVFFFVDSIVF